MGPQDGRGLEARLGIEIGNDDRLTGADLEPVVHLDAGIEAGPMRPVGPAAAGQLVQRMGVGPGPQQPAQFDVQSLADYLHGLFHQFVQRQVLERKLAEARQQAVLQRLPMQRQLGPATGADVARHRDDAGYQGTVADRRQRQVDRKRPAAAVDQDGALQAIGDVGTGAQFLQ